MSQASSVRFNYPTLTGNELFYIRDVFRRSKLSGNGYYTSLCERKLEAMTGCKRALLTHSCTAALEMAALLLDIQKGDEVIMPSFTFVSTANAFALRGARPVFVDIRPDTFHIDNALVEDAITAKTRAIVPVHYAGTPCRMDEILGIAKRHRIAVIEDAAQALGSSYKGRALGTHGSLGAVSFHETKNIMCGEGGALLINRKDLINRAEVIQNKGTDRLAFDRGKRKNYSWVDLGSSFTQSEILAAILWAQLKASGNIMRIRRNAWRRYHEALLSLEESKLIKRPAAVAVKENNAHLYAFLVKSISTRDCLLQYLARQGIRAVSHYVPLHRSKGGKRFGKTHGTMRVTDAVSDRIVRLPMGSTLTASDQRRVITALYGFFGISFKKKYQPASRIPTGSKR